MKKLSWIRGSGAASIGLLLVALVFGFLVGQIMKATQGKANPQKVNEILREKLKPAG